MYAVPFCTCVVLWFSDKVIWLPVSAQSQSLCSVSASCSPLDVASDRIQSLDSDVAPSFTQHSESPRTCAHFIMWNRDEAKCLHAAEWQKPPVTWINSCMYDGAPAVVYGTLQSKPPTHTHTPYFNSPLRLTILLLQAYCMKPIHLFSVETWQRALICDGTSVLQAPTKYTGTRLSKKRAEGGLSGGDGWWVGEGGQQGWCYEMKWA